MIRKVMQKNRPAKSITLRGCPPELMREIEARAKKQRVSLNRAVLGMLEEALGMDEPRQPAKHHDLDGFFGRWSKSEGDRFDGALQSQRGVDPEVWK